MPGHPPCRRGKPPRSASSPPSRPTTATTATAGAPSQRTSTASSPSDGDIEYCSAPAGHDDPDIVYRVQRRLGGTAAAQRDWHQTIVLFLVSNGFSTFGSDACLLRKAATIRGVTQTVLLGISSDHISATYSHDGADSLFASVNSLLLARADISDIGYFTDMPDIEFETSTPGQITLHQKDFILSLAETYPGYKSATGPTTSPACSDIIQHSLLALDPHSPHLDDLDEAAAAEYNALVNSLAHCATSTRPDIAYAVGMLCRNLDRPCALLLDDAYRVLAYLVRHSDLGLTYVCSDEPLSGMSDSDWAVRRSTTGWVFTYGMAAISWGSTIQDSISLSSCEAEIMAASCAAGEAIHLDDLMKELHLSDGSPISVGVDNKAARDLAYNPEHHDKTKHNPRRHFWVRELVENHRITVPYVHTLLNMADFFTKPLMGGTFTSMRDRIMNVGSRVHPDTRNGGVSQPH